MKPHRSLALIALLTACDSDEGSAARCSLEGAPVQLPHARYFDLAAHGEDFILVSDTAQGVAAHLIQRDSDAPDATLELGAGLIAVAARAGEVFAQSFPLGWGTAKLARFDGSAWTHKTSEGMPLTTIRRGGALAANADEIVSLWIEMGASPQVLTASWLGGTLGPTSRAFADAEIQGDTVHATFDGAGRLHVAAYGTVNSQSGLLHTVREDGAWTPTRFVGSLDDFGSNTITTAIGADSNGSVWLAEQHGSDFFEETPAGLTFWRSEGNVMKRVAAVRETRLVGEGIALAGLSDGRLVATSSWGANNLDPKQSEDSVTLTVCDSAGCAKGATLDGRRGVFYETTKVAAVGAGGVAAWAWEEKGGSEQEGLTVQRFRCDLP